MEISSRHPFVLRFLAFPDEANPLNLRARARACILIDQGDDLPEGKLEGVIHTPISTNFQIGSFDLLIKNYMARMAACQLIYAKPEGRG